MIGFHFHREFFSLFISVLLSSVLAVAALNYGMIVFKFDVYQSAKRPGEDDTSHRLKHDQLRQCTVCAEEVGRQLPAAQQTQSNTRLHSKLCFCPPKKKRIRLFSC